MAGPRVYIKPANLNSSVAVLSSSSDISIALWFFFTFPINCIERILEFVDYLPLSGVFVNILYIQYCCNCPYPTGNCLKWVRQQMQVFTTLWWTRCSPILTVCCCSSCTNGWLVTAPNSASTTPNGTALSDSYWVTTPTSRNRWSRLELDRGRGRGERVMRSNTSESSIETSTTTSRMRDTGTTQPNHRYVWHTSWI